MNTGAFKNQMQVLMGGNERDLCEDQTDWKEI